jgi:NADH-quinone oxidoreductase subunit G
VAEQAPEPYVALNRDDASRLGVEEGDTVELEINRRRAHAPLKVVPGIPSGCAGLPVGLPGVRTFPEGPWAKLGRAP